MPTPEEARALIDAQFAEDESDDFPAYARGFAKLRFISESPLPASPPPPSTGLEAIDRDGRSYPIEPSDCLDDETERLMTRLAFGPDVPEATANLRDRIRELALSPDEAELLRWLIEDAPAEDGRLNVTHPLVLSIVAKSRSMAASPLPSSPPPPSLTQETPAKHRPPVSCSVCGAEVKNLWDVERHAREHASAVAPEEPPELKETIGNLIDAVREYDKLHVPYTDDEWSGIVDTARAALVSLYNRQREEIGRLETRDAQSDRIIRRLEAKLRLQSGKDDDR